MRDDFAVFILTHGRPDNVLTVKTLERGNYNGKLYYVVDNEDDTIDRYRELYGDRVIMFDKKDIAARYDTADNFDNRKTIFYARNACFEIAEKIGVKYFLELDDDYTSILYRYIDRDTLSSKHFNDLNRLFEVFVSFLERTGVKSICFAQGGDLIGGVNNKRFHEKIIRKAMNSFFCSTENPFQFVGRINEDVNTYTSLGLRGDLFFTIMDVALTQVQTQKNKSGMTDVYIESGTYLKTFYSVMYAPSCVKVGLMGETNRRIHHKIIWNNCAPKILSSKYKN